MEKKWWMWATFTSEIRTQRSLAGLFCTKHETRKSVFSQHDDTRGTVVYGWGEISEFLLCSLFPDNTRTLMAELAHRSAKSQHTVLNQRLRNMGFYRFTWGASGVVFGPEVLTEGGIKQHLIAGRARATWGDGRKGGRRGLQVVQGGVWRWRAYSFPLSEVWRPEAHRGQR